MDDGKNIFWLAAEYNIPSLLEYDLFQSFKSSSIALCSDGSLADINSQDSLGWTALHFACNKGPDHFEVIRRLLHLGADVTKRSKSKDTALQ